MVRSSLIKRGHPFNDRQEEDGFEFDLITLRIARLDLSDVTGKKPDKIEYTRIARVVKKEIVHSKPLMRIGWELSSE